MTHPPKPAPIADEALVELDRHHFARLHRLQHDSATLAKPKLGASLTGWAADEITALRAALAALPPHTGSGDGEVQRLREVAKPILDHMEIMIDRVPSDEPGVTDSDWVAIRIGWLRALRAALNGGDHD